jgi:hypothetical protein
MTGNIRMEGNLWEIVLKQGTLIKRKKRADNQKRRLRPCGGYDRHNPFRPVCGARARRGVFP